MTTRHRFAAALLCCMACPAWSKGWDPFDYTVRMNAFGSSDAFPGSIGSGPDRGFEPSVELGRGRRLSKVSKLALSASAGGRVQQEFTRANYAWFGGGGSFRRAGSTYTLDGEWTPKRNKFPTDPEEGGEFASVGVTGGLRQAVGKRVRLRLDGTLDREKFIPLFAARDNHGRELVGSMVLSATRSIDLRGEASWTRDHASAPKYDKASRWAGAAIVWSDSIWRTDLGARSGVRRYPKTILGDSNFERRDQWIELRLRVARKLRSDLNATFGASLTDQTSSRTDRNYLAQTFTLGMSWTGGGK